MIAHVARVAPRAPAAGERWAERAILAVAAAVALLAGSNLFQVSGWMLGDIAYHRGVAHTMQGVAWQGEGPYPGLLSYYGGLYPLLLGRLAALGGLPFDTVLSLVSWAAALAWPAALWFLGRRVWPDDRLGSALFVLLGTTAGPFTHRVLVWVDSVLASAQNAFPLYPRDVAIILVVVLAGTLLGGRRRERVLASGLVLGAIVLVHLQIALLAAWLATAWTVLRARAERSTAPLAELAAMAGLAGAVSSWWWIPRLAAAVESGGLLLGGFPGSAELRLNPGNLLMAFGVVGVLALLGLAVLAARRPLPGRLGPFLVWLAAFVPLIALDRAAGGFDLLSERRVWLLASLPLTVVAASVALLAVRRLAPGLAVAFVALVVVAPSLPAAAATSRLVEGAWAPGRAGGRTFDAAAWEPVFRELNRRVREDGRHVVATYDAYATWVWSFSGAQVTSLWLPGPFKLGFDPGPLTGTGHDQRVAAQTEAFQAGLVAICDHARRFGAGSTLLDAEDGLVGLHDLSIAAPFRVPVRERSEATIRRPVAPGTTYVDRGSVDVLSLEAGATWSPGWHLPDARRLALEIAIPAPLPGTPAQGPREGPVARLAGAGAPLELGAGLGPGFHRLSLPLAEGVDRGLTVEALAPVDLVRLTAFSPVAGPAPSDGPVLRDAAGWCGQR